MNCFAKLLILASWLGGCLSSSIYAQDKVSIKTNLLGDATGSIHLGLEYGLSTQWSLELSGGYNAWDFPQDRKWRHLLIQPETRYWFCERNNGAFIGIHAHWMKFNIGQVKMPFGLWKGTRHRRFEGDLWGGGISFGYSWLLSKHWNLEAVTGIGYGHVLFDQYPCAECGKILLSDRKNYWGPTKAAVNLVYVF